MSSPTRDSQATSLSESERAEAERERIEQKAANYFVIDLEGLDDDSSQALLNANWSGYMRMAQASVFIGDKVATFSGSQGEAEKAVVKFYDGYFRDKNLSWSKDFPKLQNQVASAQGDAKEDCQEVLSSMERFIKAVDDCNSKRRQILAAAERKTASSDI